jgi:dTDP-4-amino-4,6-dideoxygalactose transaminase
MQSEHQVRDIPFGRPMLGEEEATAVGDVLSSPQLVHGPRAKAFEVAFAASLGPNAHTTTVSSCTAGLHLAYMHLGIGPGDEVIVPAQTHVATAHTVEITGARPVFVDCEPDTGNIDVNQIETHLTERTRAISVVHYPGLPVDMQVVNEIAHEHDLFVVEDCALAIGASLDGVACGLLGDVGTFSFYPIKHITTGEGGMVVSRHPDVITSIENIKAFGYDRRPSERKIPGVYNVSRLGLNYRMNELAAAIGLQQMEKVQDFALRRSANAIALRAALADVEEIAVLADGDSHRVHANYCVVGVLDDNIGPRRADIVSTMKALGVGTSVYYPVPLPLSTYYSTKYGYRYDSFPNSLRISDYSIALPIGPHLDEDDMQAVAATLKVAITEIKR